jgi:methyl-accepting chemotaxis protein
VAHIRLGHLLDKEVSMLRNFTIKARLGLNLFLLCTLLLAAGCLGVYGTVVNHGVSERLVKDEGEVVIIGRINIKVFDSRLHIAQAQLNQESSNLMNEGRILQDNNAETIRDLAELQKLAAGTDKAAVVENFVKTVSAFAENYLRPIETALLAGDAQKLGEVIKSTGNKYYSPIKQSRTDLMKAIEESTEKNRAEAKATYRLTLTLIGILVGLGLVFAIIVGLMIARSISRDTSNLLTGMLRIQQDHDLSFRLPVSGSDELSEIAIAVNKLLESLHQFARSVHDQSEGNIDTVTTLVSKSESVSDSAQQQNIEARSANQQLGEIVASIHSIAHYIKETLELTTSGSQLGQQGSTVVNGTANEMAKLADQVKEAAVDIQKLDEQSSQIDAVVSAINDIAEQTNLLALNAAIEAARAGESGRGFAVVADEVRKLAERTREMTNEIQQTIGSIRKETASATDCMEKGRQLAESGVQTAQQAAKVIVEIQDALNAINQAVSSVAATLDKQEAMADSVSSQIEKIARLSEENAQNADSSRNLAQASERSSRSLAHAAALFKV